MTQQSPASRGHFLKLRNALDKLMGANRDAWASTKPSEDSVRRELDKQYVELLKALEQLFLARRAYEQSNLAPSQAEKRLAKAASDANDWLKKIKKISDLLKATAKILDMIAALAGLFP